MTATDATGSPADVVVDVVIAVHTAQRPIARAVASALAAATPTSPAAGDPVPVRVTVVAHNVAPALVEANLAGVAVPQGSSVRVLAYTDDTRSPAGPFNHGLDAARAPYVAVMGSDDRLAPGAIASWLALARSTGAAAVIARLAKAHPDGSVAAVVPTPPARPLRTTRLDGVRDRLSYRSAPLGLLERATLERLGLRFTLGHEVGEDVAFVTRLWFSGAPIAFDRRGPAYLVQDDAGDRITGITRPVTAELAFLTDLVSQGWFTALPLPARRAAAVKFLRIHVFGLLLNRTAPFWTPAERAALADVVSAVLHAAPGCERVLSRADCAVLRAVADPASDVGQLIALAHARRRHGRPTTVVTADLTRLFAREAPLRLMAASVLARR
ncbi:Glycosyl transferase family 2 [Sanguibacter gelidistatuariae]|uniref:Glycosyl transferase family 2 n=1 Tax=Sanguibacter gelidistatuariae TaxID=1814289 RepID=A0A1G6QQT5_9MICO|nr:glycosyltransferase [Sanguibacter gelidistatuariae]SDC94334.1 Glycosyl transferase family 2 [Sanguibacter gelidistatuariae]